MKIHANQRPSCRDSARAARPRSQLTGAGNLLERDTRVISALEPVEPPVTSRLELAWEPVTVRARRHAAVLGAPAVRWRSPFARAAVEDADATAGDLSFVSV